MNNSNLNNYYKEGVIITVAGTGFSLESGSKAMNIDWMTKKDLAQAIPPAYTEYIGKQIYDSLPH